MEAVSILPSSWLEDTGPAGYVLGAMLKRHVQWNSQYSKVCHVWEQLKHLETS